MSRAIHSTASASALLLALSSTAVAQLYSQNFDVNDTANWRINEGPTDEAANFFFDYSTVGIPPAPNSLGTTRGMKLAANLTDGTFAGFSVSPIGRSFTGDYTLRFDLWSNYLGNDPVGVGVSANGSTMLSTYGIMSSGTSANYPASVDGVFFANTGDGGSSFDYRAYSPERLAGYQSPQIVPADANATFFAGSLNSSAPLYANNFGGATVPAAQTALFPSTQHGTTPSGALGFKWQRVEIENPGGLITWKVNGVPLVTVNSNLFSIPTSGSNILFGHADVNAGISLDPNYPLVSFTLIDNISVIAPAIVGNWNTNGGGNWTSASNWATGIVPNGTDHVANFPATVTLPSTISVNMPQTVGVMNFDGTVQYTIAGPSAITVDGFGAPAAINVFTGTHAISAPLTLADELTIFVDDANAALSISSQVSAGTQTINKTGNGSLLMKNVRAGHLNIATGTVRVPAGATPNASDATSVVKALTIADSAQFDLTNTAAVLDYSGGIVAPLTPVRQHLASGRLFSSAATSNAKLGFANNAVLGRTTFAGQTVDSTSILIMFTVPGDANLDGITNISDFSSLAANFNLPSTWLTGDFDYSGTTNISDFSLLAANFNRSLSDLPRARVPEPAATALALFLTAAMLGPRNASRRFSSGFGTAECLS